MSWLKHALIRIEDAELVSDPFEHFVAANVFDEEFYRSLLENIPQSEQIARLKTPGMGISQSRCIVDVKKLQSPFWNTVATALSGSEFADCALKKFGRKFASEDYVTTEIVQDKLGYSIGPHTDIVSKKMTILFYLPTDNSLQEFGTSICRTLDASLIGSEYHHAWQHFEERHVVPFLPNTAFGFCRTDKSFHAVRRIHKDVTRNTLCVTIRTQSGHLDFAANTAGT
jgi:hypothetical protein